jgi:hypothetical protein
MKFQMFDSVKLTEPIPLGEGGSAQPGTVGAIVEVFNDGEAYLVELFGGWVKYDEQENFIPAERAESGAFMETIGVETVYPQQLQLLKRAVPAVRSQLLAVLDELPDDLLEEVKDFAEFLKQKQERRVTTNG